MRGRSTWSAHGLQVEPAAEPHSACDVTILAHSCHSCCGQATGAQQCAQMQADSPRLTKKPTAWRPLPRSTPDRTMFRLQDDCNGPIRWRFVRSLQGWAWQARGGGSMHACLACVAAALKGSSAAPRSRDSGGIHTSRHQPPTTTINTREGRSGLRGGKGVGGVPEEHRLHTL